MFIAVFELPLYFQAVKNHSPTRAGIDMIPITIALVFASGVFGGVTSVCLISLRFPVRSSLTSQQKFGRYWHIMVIGPLFGVVGYGLVFLMDEHASWGLLIGSQYATLPNEPICFWTLTSPQDPHRRMPRFDVAK